MNLAVLRVGLALMWLVVGVGLLTRGWWADPGLDARTGGRNLTLFGAAAVALAVWNVLRLALSRRGPAVDLRKRLAARRRAGNDQTQQPRPPERQ